MMESYLLFLVKAGRKGFVKDIRWCLQKPIVLALNYPYTPIVNNMLANVIVVVHRKKEAQGHLGAAAVHGKGR